MLVSIDKNSGFCFGVVKAIDTAEMELQKYTQIYCLGDIVHNNEEVFRLKKMGMKVLNHNDLEHIENSPILIRAHGEPPQTYNLIKKNNNTIIDATCAVVLRLQQNVKKGYLQMQEKNGQVVIFGKKGHAEVIGLVGQTDNTAIVISSIDEVESLDFHIPMRLYAQTTQNLNIYKSIVCAIENAYAICGNTNPDFVWFDTICRQVANREESLKKFAKSHDVIIFVAGEKSSNGMVLFEICKTVNTHSYLISSVDSIDIKWFNGVKSVGVCGATSTPFWLMENVANYIKENNR